MTTKKEFYFSKKCKVVFRYYTEYYSTIELKNVVGLEYYYRNKNIIKNTMHS